MRRAEEGEAARARAAAPLRLEYDAALPVSARREEILQALRDQQVLIVAGDTGSGKSTQLPKMCLELGLGIEGLIAHTQPRRLAARALAARIADELAQPLGVGVGFRVRFADRVSAATRLVLMTDGLLLAELARDPLLHRYDTVIVDEAHERTLNVDLLLGVLRRLTVRRPELKVLVTSATLDVERMAAFFGGAPVVSVSGRSHPIEVRYAPELPEPEEPDLPAAVLEACREIVSELPSGDILVFLPGEREIADVGEALDKELTGFEVLPLYSRLAWEQQSRILLPGARRRVVLATNVAETSITVPGVRAVVDSGLARISRYSVRSRLQRLPIEAISRASAEQRKGRCGRLGPGLCLRLYTESNFLAREEYTEPEVLRTNLAALLLRLAADDLGAAEEFPFIDAPDSRALNDGYRLLQELDALDAQRRITRRGRSMARLPLDPRLARALLESKRFRAEGELLAIVSGLSVPDPRLAAGGGEREDAPEADALEDTRSEFMSLVGLWRAYRQARTGTRRELRRWCTARRLSLLRLSEWDNVHAQVSEAAAELGIGAQGGSASYAAVHRALLAGFCTMVGVRGDEGQYLGTRGVRFYIFPGSPLRRRKPRWVMAANIVETSRVFARRVAEIEPSWIEAAAEHLIKREYLEPDWDERRAEVIARERTTFLGLTLRNDRIVNYGPIAPEEARHIFCREGIVYQRLRERPQWLRANDELLAAAQRTEERLRTRDLVVGAESLVAFYDQVLPRQVSSAATLEYFSRHMNAAEQRAVRLSPAVIYAREPDAAALAAFPERIEQDGLALQVGYRFAPGEAEDGATLRLPLLALPLMTRGALERAIPGLVKPRVEALLRSLPKEARRQLIPIADTAAAFIADTAVAAGGSASLALWLKETRGLPAASIRLDAAGVAPYLTPRITVVDGGARVAHGAELEALRRATADRARAALDALARAAHPLDWRGFEAEFLDPIETIDIEGGRIAVHLGLDRDGDRLGVSFDWSAEEAARRYAAGAVRLVRRMLDKQLRDLARRVGEDSKLLLAASPFMRGEQLTELVLQLCVRRACFKDATAPRGRDDFAAAVDSSRAELHDALLTIIGMLAGWFAEARVLRGLLEDCASRGLGELAAESRRHLAALLDAQRLATAPSEWSAQLARYLKAEQRRWERLRSRGREAPAVAAELDSWTRRLQGLEQRVAGERRWLAAVDELGWWIEEYRVSLYAQELKTLRAVSAARLEQRAAAVEAWLRR